MMILIGFLKVLEWRRVKPCRLVYRLVWMLRVMRSLLVLSLCGAECVVEQITLSLRGGVRILLVIVPGSKRFFLSFLLLVFQIDQDRIGIPNRTADLLVRNIFPLLKENSDVDVGVCQERRRVLVVNNSNPAFVLVMLSSYRSSEVMVDGGTLRY